MSPEPASSPAPAAFEQAVLGAVDAVALDVFGKEVDPRQDFFADVGLDSLQVAMMASTIEAAFGVDLIEEIFVTSTVAGLAEIIARALREGAGDIDLIDHDALPAPVLAAVVAVDPAAVES